MASHGGFHGDFGKSGGARRREVDAMSDFPATPLDLRPALTRDSIPAEETATRESKRCPEKFLKRKNGLLDRRGIRTTEAHV